MKLPEVAESRGFFISKICMVRDEWYILISEYTAQDPDMGYPKKRGFKGKTWAEAEAAALAYFAPGPAQGATQEETPKRRKDDNP